MTTENITQKSSIELGYEPDSTDNLRTSVMWGAVITFTIFILVTVFALIMYFRFEVHSEQFYKVGSRVSSERITLEQEEKAALKKNNIDDAMDKFLRDLK